MQSNQGSQAISTDGDTRADRAFPCSFKAARRNVQLACDPMWGRFSCNSKVHPGAERLLKRRFVFARRGSGTRDGQEPGFPRLGGKANGGIGGAKTLIVAALHDLEEEPLVERVGIDLEELAPSPSRS